MPQTYSSEELDALENASKNIQIGRITRKKTEKPKTYTSEELDVMGGVSPIKMTSETKAKIRKGVEFQHPTFGSVLDQFIATIGRQTPPPVELTKTRISGESVKPLLTIGGSVAGELGAGPAGAGVGAGAGYATGEVLQSLEPEIFGEPSDIPDYIKNITFEGLLNAGLAGASRAFAGTKAAIKAKLAKTSLTQEQLKALEETGIKDVASVSQIKGSKMWKMVEDIFGPEKKEAIIKAEQEIGKGKLADVEQRLAGGIPLAEDTPKITQRLINKTLAKERIAHAEETAAYESFKTTHAANNKAAFTELIHITPKQVGFAPAAPSKPIVGKLIEVQAPIVTERASSFAQQVKDSLTPIFDRAKEIGDDVVIPKLNLIKSVVDDLVSSSGNIQDVVMPTGQTVKVLRNSIKDWEKVKEFRTAIKDVIRSRSTNERSKGALIAMDNALGGDITESISKYWNDPQEALTSLRVAGEKTIQKEKTFGLAVEDALKKAHDNWVHYPPVGTPETITEKYTGRLLKTNLLMDAAFKNPLLLDRMIQASGSKQEYALEGLRRLRDKHIKNTPTGQDINWKNVLNEFESPDFKRIAKKIYTRNQRNELKTIFNALSTVDKTLGDTARTSVVVRVAHSALNVPVGLAMALGSHSVGFTTGTVAGAAVVGFAVATHQFADKVLLNPKVSKYVAQLAKAPPQAPQSQAMARKVFQALQGTRASVIVYDAVGNATPTGQEITIGK